MTTNHTRLVAVGGALLLLLVGATWTWSRWTTNPSPPAASETFHPSDVALIGHTGLPQLVEFYHPG